MTDVLRLDVRRLERDLLHHFLQDRMEAPGADVLRVAVDVLGDLGDLVDRVRGELDPDVLGREEGRCIA